MSGSEPFLRVTPGVVAALVGLGLSVLTSSISFGVLYGKLSERVDVLTEVRANAVDTRERVIRLEVLVNSIDLAIDRLSAQRRADLGYTPLPGNSP